MSPGVPLRARSAEVAFAAILAPLTILASAGGLLLADLYRDSADILPAIRGQDLVTLLVAPATLVAARLAVRGSLRARLIEIGLLAYITYTYAGAAFGYRFNRFFLIYVALFSVSVFAIVAVVLRVADSDLRRHFDGGSPRRPVAVFLVFIAVVLAAVELSEIVRFLATGAVPESVRRAGDLTFFPYVLDLGFIAPLAVAAAVGLWREAGWSYVLAAVLLVKATTMGCALISMNWLTTRAGLPPDGLSTFYGVLAAGGLGLSVWFFRHCHAASTWR